MRPSTRSDPPPWIEALILSYGREPSSSGRLKARVVRVEQMSQSQAQGSDCPTGLLLLSDGCVTIPAVLTAAAWERLQDQDERDCLEGLVNSKVTIQDYRLQFHMSQEQTRCRFFLSVGDLVMISVGPPGYPPPCCTTLAPVRQKMAQTWKEQLQEKVQDSQSQSGLDLSLLLGEWHQDCMLDILKDVEDRLMELPHRLARPQPSTSSSPHPGPAGATCWDADRLRFKRGPSLSVPLRCLLLPDHLQAVPEDGGSQPDRDWLPPPVHHPQAEAEPTAAGTELDVSVPVSEDHMTTGSPSNPWDVFTPLGESPCWDAQDGLSPAAPTSAPAPTSASAPAHQRSCLPPYQQPPQVELHTSTSTSAGALQLQLPVSGGEPGGAKRRRRSQPEEAGQEEAQVSSSPPSWLFDTQTDCGASEQQQDQDQVLRRTPSTHSDGRSFSYSYRVSGQNLQDLSRFSVRTAWLQWAIRYLLHPDPDPDQDPGPDPALGSSEQTEACRM